MALLFEVEDFALRGVAVFLLVDFFVASINQLANFRCFLAYYDLNIGYDCKVRKYSYGFPNR